MPAKIIYRKSKQPKISVIIPTFAGNESKLKFLIDQIKSQTEKDIEIILSIRERPNGHARNVAVEKASGRYLISLDDDITLGSPRIFRNLISALQRPGIGLAGASVSLPAGTSWLESQYHQVRGFEIPPAVKITPGKASHACLAITTELYKAVGWESDNLITGTDDDLRYRIKKQGYRVVIAPNCTVYHRPPGTLKKIIRASFNKGLGAAFALKNVPYIFPYPKLGTQEIKNEFGVLIYFLLTLPIRFIVDLISFRPVLLAVELFQNLGFMYGYFRYHI